MTYNYTKYLQGRRTRQMEIITLKKLEIISPISQTLNFIEATLVIETDEIGFKMWFINLTGPPSLAHHFLSAHETLQLIAEAEDKRTFRGSAFVKQCKLRRIAEITFQGTGSLEQS